MINRKKVIAAVTLLTLIYYGFEIFFHGIWDLLLSEEYGSIKAEIKIWALHESVDFLTILFLLIAINCIKQRPNLNLDVSYFDERRYIESLKKAKVYVCEITK